MARETRYSFWRQKKGSLPRLLDPPLGGIDGSAGAVRAEELRLASLVRSVEGIVDSEKLSVLETCAIGWVKETISIRVLAQELATAGLDGFELMWVAGLMVLLLFPDVESRGSMLSTKDVWSAWFGCLKEAEVVRVPAIEQRDVETGSEMGDKSQDASVLWNLGRSGNGCAESEGAIDARPAGAGAGCVGASAGTGQLTGDRGCVCSAGAALDVFVGDRSRECVATVQALESVGRRDSLVGLLDCGEGNLATTGRLQGDNCASSSLVAVIGNTGAALASVLGSVLGGVRKVKFVNCLVKTLGSPEQRRVVAIARSRKGCGRPAKACGLVEAGDDVVNPSLTDSDIQGYLLLFRSRCVWVATLTWFVGLLSGRIGRLCPEVCETFLSSLSLFDHYLLVLLNDDTVWGPRPFQFLTCWLDNKVNVRRFGSE
ncbi:hypothetical protein V6N12_048135 [Hibiscus sabdariffa]|uniref:Uncharacterized protein n=1 Tax=Hibiscus sabdariffa TaxID=183260 RepID=A0ABR2EGE5_9ROSI